MHDVHTTLAVHDPLEVGLCFFEQIVDFSGRFHAAETTAGNDETGEQATAIMVVRQRGFFETTDDPVAEVKCIAESFQGQTEFGQSRHGIQIGIESRSKHQMLEGDRVANRFDVGDGPVFEVNGFDLDHAKTGSFQNSAQWHDDVPRCNGGTDHLRQEWIEGDQVGFAEQEDVPAFGNRFFQQSGQCDTCEPTADDDDVPVVIGTEGGHVRHVHSKSVLQCNGGSLDSLFLEGFMMQHFRFAGLVLMFLLLGVTLAGCAQSPRLNEIQFVGSHNSYKQAMSPTYREALEASNPDAARAIDYEHLSLDQQLDLGIRKIELDVFNDPSSDGFPVGHIQVIDMNSSCAGLRQCLDQIVVWSRNHPMHVPIWISFNLKDEKVAGLPDPAPFDGGAMDRLDNVLRQALGETLLQPGSIGPGNWPRVDAVRGRFLLILDEQGPKLDLYVSKWRERPMFVNVPADHPAAAVMILNEPVAEFDHIQAMVRQGFLVRTRADADTREARSGDTTRRDAAFASGAQAISTDYYLPASRFGTNYVVSPAAGVWCNPITSKHSCRVTE
jgi:Phosphoinositide phospholipase C, Ca2+-dependent